MKVYVLEEGEIGECSTIFEICSTFDLALEKLRELANPDEINIDDLIVTRDEIGDGNSVYTYKTKGEIYHYWIISEWDLVQGDTVTPDLTEQQRKLYLFIKGSKLPPNMEEMCLHLGVRSKATIANHLGHLEEKGYIRRKKYQARAIEVLK